MEPAKLTEAPATWFLAAEVHLHDKDTPDVLVMPNNECMFGATTDPFWVFGKTANGFALILRTDQLALEILKSKTNGYLDIRGKSEGAREFYMMKFKYDGQKYALADTQVIPIGK